MFRNEITSWALAAFHLLTASTCYRFPFVSLSDLLCVVVGGRSSEPRDWPLLSDSSMLPLSHLTYLCTSPCHRVHWGGRTPPSWFSMPGSGWRWGCFQTSGLHWGVYDTYAGLSRMIVCQLLSTGSSSGAEDLGPPGYPGPDGECVCVCVCDFCFSMFLDA